MIGSDGPVVGWNELEGRRVRCSCWTAMVGWFRWREWTVEVWRRMLRGLTLVVEVEA